MFDEDLKNNYYLLKNRRILSIKYLFILEIFFINFDLKNGCKNDFEDNNENHAADSEIRFLTKWISKLYGRATAMPPAWEFTYLVLL